MLVEASFASQESLQDLFLAGFFIYCGTEFVR
jgi:hypothetical protein